MESLLTFKVNVCKKAYKKLRSYKRIIQKIYVYIKFFDKK